MRKKRAVSAKKILKIKIIIAAVFAVALVFIALFAGIIAPNDPYETNAAAIRQAPCPEYPFGTDNLGRCVFSRVLYGAGTSLGATFILVLVSFVLGTSIGMLCGYFGGWPDRLLMRVADIVLSLPQMVVAIVVAGILKGGLAGAMISLGITLWVGFARQARSHTYEIKKQAYISAAVLAGKNCAFIICRHILPNLMLPLLTSALTQIGTVMIGISGLSFLGIGAVAPKAEWGSMISEARAYIQLAPWTVMYPTVAIVASVIVFNYLGDKVMDYREI